VFGESSVRVGYCVLLLVVVVKVDKGLRELVVD